MRVEIKERHREYDGFFKLERAVLRWERFDGRMSKQVERLLFERGDSVAVLLYDRGRDTVVLVEQFRYPAYVREAEGGRLFEIVAGTIDGGRSPEEVARAELAEEAGYSVQKLEHVATFYLSPGACSERMHLYLGSISSTTSTAPGGGNREEGEDIRVVEMPLADALGLVQQGVIRDAKTIIALQHLCLCTQREG